MELISFQWGLSTSYREKVNFNLELTSSQYIIIIHKHSGNSAFPAQVKTVYSDRFTVYQYQGDYSNRLNWLLIQV